MNRLRTIATGAAVCLGLLVLSATPANARPVIDEDPYYGPGASATHETLCFASVWPWKDTWCIKLPR